MVQTSLLSYRDVLQSCKMLHMTATLILKEYANAYSFQFIYYKSLIILISFNILLLNKNSILFTSCVKISEQYLEYYAKYSLFNLKGSKSKVTKLEFRLKSAFQWGNFNFICREAIFISFVMLSNEKRHFIN